MNENGNTIKIIVVDDQENIRKGLRRILSRASEIEVIGEAQSGKEALEIAHRLDPDLMLLDVEMPGMKGDEVARRLMETDSMIQVLAVSGHIEKHYILGMFASGVVGYLSKDEAPQYLLTAVRAIAAGKKGWISAKVAEKMGLPAASLGQDTIPMLTAKEIQIIKLIVKGFSDQEIGDQLHLENFQVKNYIQSITRKLSVKSRQEVILRALQEGLI